MKHYDAATAARALERWDADPATLEHLATSGNAVYAFRDAAGTRRILRLTDLTYRSLDHQRAEMALLDHVAERGAQVTRPVPSAAGHAVEAGDGFTACVLTWAPGEIVTPDSPHWTDAFVHDWGGALGRIHAAARDYRGPARWDWDAEVLLARAELLLPREDAALWQEWRAVMDHLHALPRPADAFGMNHADHAPQNFHWHPAGGITTFDFGNCCRHWFVNDVVIALSTLRRLPGRDRWRDALLAGYRSEHELTGRWWAERHWFLRLRMLYVYLSRRMKFGPTPTSAESDTLRSIRSWIVPHHDWP